MKNHCKLFLFYVKTYVKETYQTIHTIQSFNNLTKNPFKNVYKQEGQDGPGSLT